MAAHQAPPSPGFSRQEHWSGLPFPSLMHESEKCKGSRSVMSDSLRPHGLPPTRLLRPWDFPGKSTGVECHCLLWYKPQCAYLYILTQPYNAENLPFIHSFFFFHSFIRQVSTKVHHHGLNLRSLICLQRMCKLTEIIWKKYLYMRIHLMAGNMAASKFSLKFPLCC